MSGDALGEWADEPDHPAGVDPEAVEDLVDEEVARQVRRQVRSIAGQAVSNAMTPAVVDHLQEHAEAASHTELTTPQPEAPRLYYGSVDEFVREIICPTFRRRVGERAPYRWSAEWWRNTEALLRLEALWRAWEHLRLDPATGMSDWLRDHADPQLAALMDREGPFMYSTDHNTPGDPLPYTPPPPGLFPDVREPQP